MRRATLSVIILLISSILFAQPDTDSDKKAEIIKQGWNFCPLPVLGFNSDLGFQYGACAVSYTHLTLPTILLV